MLMDLAFDNIAVEPKRRTHFHAFMLEVHERLREARKSEEGDPVIRVAEQIAEEVKFLAFDEMMVTNSADAMIMSRLFTALIDEGVAIVTTSNRPPTRPLQGRAQPRAVPALHRPDRARRWRCCR